MFTLVFLKCAHYGTDFGTRMRIFSNSCADNVTIILKIWHRHMGYGGAAKAKSKLKTQSTHLSPGGKRKRPTQSQSFCFKIWLIFLAIFVFEMYLVPWKKVLCFPFFPPQFILIFNLQSARWTFCKYVFDHIFFLRWRRLADERCQLTYMLLLYLPRKDHLYVVLIRAFFGFNHDTHGWINI